MVGTCISLRWHHLVHFGQDDTCTTSVSLHHCNDTPIAENIQTHEYRILYNISIQNGHFDKSAMDDISLG